MARCAAPSLIFPWALAIWGTVPSVRDLIFPRWDFGSFRRPKCTDIVERPSVLTRKAISAALAKTGRTATTLRQGYCCAAAEVAIAIPAISIGAVIKID